MLYGILGGIVLLVDQLTKAGIRRDMIPGQSVPLIDGVLHVTYVENRGAAFGLLPDMKWLFVAVTVFVIILAYVYRHWWTSAGTAFRFGLTIGMAGVFGNFIDRLFIGRVTDFIDFRVFPVFNVADAAITVGAVCIAWTLWKHDEGASREAA